MIFDEAYIQKLEDQLPLASGRVFAEARQQVLRSGQSVLQSMDGFIFRVYPSGKAVLVNVIDRPTPAIPGTTYELS